MVLSQAPKGTQWTHGTSREGPSTTFPDTYCGDGRRLHWRIGPAAHLQPVPLSLLSQALGEAQPAPVVLLDHTTPQMAPGFCKPGLCLSSPQEAVAASATG